MAKMEEETYQKVRHAPSGAGLKHSYFGQYVTFEGSLKLQTYQYHGSDNSLIYKHILNPMNNYLVEFLPVWLAPNVITLTALLMVFFTHVVMLCYCPNLEGEAPRWVYVLSAFTLFAYQTLDNLDGKQARRTGTSSPLGLLFDHGCDAINVTIGCTTMACITQLGAGWKTVVLFLIASSPFILATWEEYYTGSLELPIINGPTEGLLIGICLKLATAYFGPQLWVSEIIPGYCFNTLILCGMAFMAIVTMTSNVYNVHKAAKKQNESMFVALTRILPFFILNTIALVWSIYSPTDIVRKHPVLFLWTLGMLNSKLVLHLMLAHLCGEEYHPFRKTLVPMFYLAAHSAFCLLQGFYPAVNEIVALNEFFYISIVAYFHVVISVICEVKDVLDIPVFSVPKIKQEEFHKKKNN